MVHSARAAPILMVRPPRPMVFYSSRNGWIRYTMRVSVELGHLERPPSSQSPILARAPSAFQISLPWPSTHLEMDVCNVSCMYPSRSAVRSGLLRRRRRFCPSSLSFQDIGPMAFDSFGNGWIRCIMHVSVELGRLELPPSSQSLLLARAPPVFRYQPNGPVIAWKLIYTMYHARIHQTGPSRMTSFVAVADSDPSSLCFQDIGPVALDSPGNRCMQCIMYVSIELGCMEWLPLPSSSPLPGLFTTTPPP
jgi:hypothetical protein